MRVFAATRQIVTGFSRGETAEEAEVALHVIDADLTETADVRRLESARDVSADTARLVRRERWNIGQHLDAAAQRVAAVLRRRRAAQHFDAVDHRRIDQIEERVDAAALRAVGEAHAVDEHVDFADSQAAHEHAGHAGAGALQA